MRDDNRPRFPSARKVAVITGILVGCFVWATVTFGLSIAMAKHDDRRWWLIPLVSVVMLLITLAAVRQAHLLVPEPRGRRSGSPAAARPPAPSRVVRVLRDPLSPREEEVLRHLARGSSNREIAAALFIAPGTVKAHVNHIFGKLEASSRLQAVAHAREAGLLDPATEINPD